jgi:RNA polymerase sigma-70 factor (ECF subfamily)
MASAADAEALFAAHRVGLQRYLLRAVGHGDTARDLTQDVFVRVVASAALPGTDGERRAWIFRIARNLAIDYQRRQQVRHGGSSAAEPAAGPAQDTAVAVNRALAMLESLDRDVFLMRESGGLSYAEIAAACDLSIEAVRSRLHRARQQLREALRGPLDAARRGPLRTRAT